MIVAGIGCRKGCTAADILAAIDAALNAHARDRDQLAALASGWMKQDEPSLLDAAHRLGLPLQFVAQGDLEQAAERTHSRSARVDEMFGLPSLAETAALAAAGPGAKLLGPRVATAMATCALAMGESE